MEEKLIIVGDMNGIMEAKYNLSSSSSSKIPRDDKMAKGQIWVTFLVINIY